MQCTRLGHTGLEVSRLCLGCMSFGDPKLGREWVLDLDKSRPIICAAWGAGINFYDTANVYSAGTSEEITGEVLWELAPRGAVAAIAAAKGATMAQVALAWVLQKQPVAAPIVGVTKIEQLTDAVGALAVSLSPEDVKTLETAYKPRATAGFQ